MGCVAPASHSSVEFAETFLAVREAPPDPVDLETVAAAVSNCPTSPAGWWGQSPDDGWLPLGRAATTRSWHHLSPADITVRIWLECSELSAAETQRRASVGDCVAFRLMTSPAALLPTNAFVSAVALPPSVAQFGASAARV
jgi:hypothetical protein